MKGNMEKVGEYEKMEEKKNKKIITECLNNVKRNSLKKEKESKINIFTKNSYSNSNSYTFSDLYSKLHFA